MKRYILTIVVCMTVLFGHAELNTEQMQLRRNVVSALSSAGYKPNIDQDGDVFFTNDNVRYWVSINENWNEPFIVTLYTEFPYNSEKDRTKTNVEACVSVVNQMKTVKLFCNDLAYTLRSDILCKDADVFKQTFQSIVEEQKKAQEYINETVSSGLGGLDLTGNKDNIYDKALSLYQKEDYYQAFKLFNYLADNGYTLAYSMLGMAYENGEGVSKDEDLMIKNYEKAIENGESWCAYNLGSYYYDKKNYAKAMDYFTQSSSSENPFRSDSYYMVGQMNENGNGVSKNISAAIQNYRKAVEYSSELESKGRMALIRLGEQVDDPKDFVDISKALLNGLSIDDMYNKGYEYENGLNNRSVSLPKAYGYYKASAEKNNAKANVKMGEIYISKFYPFNDKAKSDKYYAKAFKALKQQESYSGDACYQLGMMYKDGLSVEKNSELAVSYFKTASAKGNADAYYELGLIYQNELERVEAFNCFMKAAEKGLPAAMLEVAKAYETGLGTSRNREQAINWYTKCEKTNTSYSKVASEALKKMGRVDDEKE